MKRVIFDAPEDLELARLIDLYHVIDRYHVHGERASMNALLLRLLRSGLEAEVGPGRDWLDHLKPRRRD